VGPIHEDYSWQARAGEGFGAAQFVIDWERELATCPQGKTSRIWEATRDVAGHDIVNIRFDYADCRACPARRQCVSSGRERAVSIRPRPLYEALREARQRQTTQAFRDAYAARAGIEGTFSQGAGLHLIGTSASGQVGMTLYEVLKTRDPGFTPLAAHLRALQGELVRYETDWRGRSFETRVEPLRADDGRISGTVGIAIDVTDRKSLYEALQTQNVYFATLFDNAPEAIAILDEHDRIIRINGQFTAMFGYTDQEAVGQSINDLIVPKELVAEGGNRTARVAAGEKLRTESLRRHKDGRQVAISLTVSPIRADSGRIVGASDTSVVTL